MPTTGSSTIRGAGHTGQTGSVPRACGALFRLSLRTWFRRSRSWCTVSMQTWNPLPLPCSVSWMPRWQEVEVAEVCDNLVSTQVLGLSPDGQLCQYVLWDASFHCVGGRASMGNGSYPQPQQIQAQTQGCCQWQHPEALMGSQAVGTPKPQPSCRFGHFAAWVAQQFRDTRAFLSRNGTLVRVLAGSPLHW